MKDVRLLYKGYIPDIIKKKNTNNTISEQSIYGNLNYSIDRELLRIPFKQINHSSNKIKRKSKRKSE